MLPSSGEQKNSENRNRKKNGNRNGNSFVPLKKASLPKRREKYFDYSVAFNIIPILSFIPFTTTFRKFRLESKLFGSFQWKISGSNGTSEKVVLFFPDGMFQTEIRAPFVQT